MAGLSGVEDLLTALCKVIPPDVGIASALLDLWTRPNLAEARAGLPHPWLFEGRKTTLPDGSRLWLARDGASA